MSDDSQSLLQILGLDFPEWLGDALCSQFDGEMFFPEQGGSPREAKSICAACPARLKCLEWALDNDERWGVFGGTTPFERRKLRRAAS